MVSVAKDKFGLKKRVLRFFDVNSKNRKSVVSFLDQLSKQADIYVFGGLVRDIALHGVASFKSDIDIVYIGDPERMHGLIRKRSAKRNKFGGYRLDIEGWQVDIWEARESWAFKMGYKEYSNIESLLDTTITNWDSILFNWNHKTLICHEDYFKDLNDGYLDVNLIDNPNVIGMYVRLLRYFSSKDTHLISPKAASLISDAVDSYTFQELRNYEEGSYNQIYITQSIYTYLKSHKGITNPDLIPIDLVKFNTTLNLTLNVN